MSAACVKAGGTLWLFNPRGTTPPAAHMDITSPVYPQVYPTSHLSSLTCAAEIHVFRQVNHKGSRANICLAVQHLNRLTAFTRNT